MNEVSAELPEASVCHHAAGRLRIRVPSRRGDTAFFAAVQDACARNGKRPQVNPQTASLLFVGSAAAPEEIAVLGREEGLFRLRLGALPHRPVMQEAVRSVAGVNRSLEQLTGGRIDLPSGVFLMLLGFGIYELLRGRWTVPPWYTAFWYAFGLVSMYVLEKGVRANPGHEPD